MEHVEAGGARIPELGLGTWQNTGDSCADAVETALNCGYRHVDTAQAYGNEAEVGDGIERADVAREDVFLTTKVWRSDLRADDLKQSVHESLDRLDVDRIDLLLLHWPHPRVPVEESLTAAAELRDDDLIEHLGVSNYTRSQLADAIDAVDAPVVANQVLYHPYKDQSNLLSFCREHDVALTAYSPLARGAVIGDDDLGAIGERYDKSAVQVALRWLIQQENVVAIPKASSAAHIEANVDVFDFELTDAEMDRIADLSPGLKTRLYNVSPAIMRRNPL